MIYWLVSINNNAMLAEERERERMTEELKGVLLSINWPLNWIPKRLEVIHGSRLENNSEKAREREDPGLGILI